MINSITFLNFYSNISDLTELNKRKERMSSTVDKYMENKKNSVSGEGHKE